jgi:transcriptional regulator with XRE-family HTH domain
VRIILNPAKPVLWGPEQEALLKSLRLSAGVDLATLARRNIVSTTQVRQLENGGDSSFYSPEIKLSVGKKLLKYLGHDLQLEVTLETPPSVSADLAQAETPAPRALDSEKASNSTTIETLVSISNENLAALPASPNSSIAVPLFLSGVALFAGMWFWFDNKPTSSQEEVKKALPELKSETKVDLSVASLPDKSASLTNSENVPAKLETTSTPKEMAKADTQSACVWNGVEEEVQPNYPIKAGEYVHVVAQQASTVCIMDGQQRVATLNLQVGEGRSIYGLSPFRVYSADLNLMKVYFQGQLIKLSSQEITQIKLTPSTQTALKN